MQYFTEYIHFRLFSSAVLQSTHTQVQMDLLLLLFFTHKNGPIPFYTPENINRFIQQVLKRFQTWMMANPLNPGVSLLVCRREAFQMPGWRLRQVVYHLQHPQSSHPNAHRGAAVLLLWAKLWTVIRQCHQLQEPYEDTHWWVLLQSGRSFGLSLPTCNESWNHGLVSSSGTTDPCIEA